MTSPQYLLLDAKWLEDELGTRGDNDPHNAGYRTALRDVKRHCQPASSIEEAVKAEREACAEIVSDRKLQLDKYKEDGPFSYLAYELFKIELNKIERHILARGGKEISITPDHEEETSQQPEQSS